MLWLDSNFLIEVSISVPTPKITTPEKNPIGCRKNEWHAILSDTTKTKEREKRYYEKSFTATSWRKRISNILPNIQS